MATQVSRVSAAVAVPRDQARAQGRILAIDALRGVALVLMALAHASFFMGAGLQAESYGGQPVFLQGPAYWGSALITHLASPIFWLLSGVSLALLEAGQRRKQLPESAITRFMLIRAGIILALDLTVCSIFWLGKTPYVHVLTTMAISMALLSVARLLPERVLLALTLVVLVAYQGYLSLIAPQLAANVPQSLLQALWLTYSYNTTPAIGFPVVGWGVLMWLGFWLGRRQGLPQLQRPLTWVAIAGGLLGLWLLLRLLGGYGDLGHFGQVGSSWVHFLVMSKAPPSLSYLAFNLGIAALILAAFHARVAWLERFPGQWLVMVGQVSLFFYVAHIIVYNLVAQVLLQMPLPGPRIIWGYVAWLLGMGVLLLLGYHYRKLRKRHPQSFLRYL